MGSAHSVVREHIDDANSDDQKQRPSHVDTSVINEIDVLSAACFTDKQRAVTECASFQRINEALRRYREGMMSLTNTCFDDILSSIEKENTYNASKLLDDYHHCLAAHSFQAVHSALHIIRKLKDDIMHNEQENIFLVRNYRNRSDAAGFVDHSDELYFNAHSNTEVLIQQILDTIYCYYVFSTHLGMILTTDEQKEIEDAKTDEHVVSMNMDGQSEKLRRMKHIILTKLQWTNSDAASFDEFRAENKFITKVRPWSINKVKPQKLSHDFYYDAGVKYFYWNKYKNNHPFYIKPKYRTLKDELTSNAICSVNAKDFVVLYEKAMIFKQKVYTKSVKANIKTKHDEQLYLIQNGSVIPLDHLICILVLCNFITLRSKFGETYRRMSPRETDKSIIARHSNFAHCGRVLFEVVHLFGRKTDLPKHVFYHAINNSNSVCLSNMLCAKAPLSLTSSRQIILNATVVLHEKDGLILEFKQNQNVICTQKVPFFDCKYYSDFTAENEILMIGNSDLAQLQITNIIDVKTLSDYKYWMLLYQMVKSLVSNHFVNTTRYDKSIKDDVVKLLGNEFNKCVKTKRDLKAIIQSTDEKKQNGANSSKSKNSNSNAVKPVTPSNPYLDMDLLKGFADFTPDKNRSFEKKYNSVKPVPAMQENEEEEEMLDSFEEGVLPHYVDEMVHGFCLNVEFVKIAWADLKDAFGYKFLNELLCEQKFDMIRLDRFTKIFSKCVVIYISGSNMMELNKKLMQYIYTFLSENSFKIHLKKLVISNICEKPNSLTAMTISMAVRQYKEKFSQLDCEVEVQNADKYNEMIVFEWK